MIVLNNNAKIYLYTGIVDMRKSIDTLSILINEALEQSPQTGDVYLFRGKSGNKIKVLYWDKNGFVLHYKRLERGRFKLPKINNHHLEISEVKLSWLLAGLDFILMNQFSKIKLFSIFLVILRDLDIISL